jgi:hypothetical protein
MSDHPELVMTKEFIETQKLSTYDAQWLQQMVRLATDNVFLYNMTRNPIALSLCKWDGTKWIDVPIRKLEQRDSAWVTVKPLDVSLILGQPPKTVGQSILVVRPHEPQDGKLAFWRVDNLSQMPLNAAAFSGARSCSRTSVCQHLWSGVIKPRKSLPGNLTTWNGDPIDAHWEYWFHEPLIPFEKPILSDRLF